MIDNYVRNTKLCIHGEKVSEIINETDLHICFECDFGGQNVIDKVINQSMQGR
jgi:hypothetical protein